MPVPPELLADLPPDPDLADVRTAVAALRQADAEGLDPSAVQEAVAHLRRVWQAVPNAFDATVVEHLRELTQAAAARRGDVSPEEVLRAVFGYPEFRPGQREIIDAVLAGRDCVGRHADRGRQVADLPDPGADPGRHDPRGLAADRPHEGPGRRARRGGDARRPSSTPASTPEDARRARRRLRRGEIELVYAAPEGLQASVALRARPRRPASDRRRRGALHQPVGARLPAGLPGARRASRPGSRACPCWR